ncbi:MAG: NAD(P)H-dependent oxidoreductase, partial [Anaerolineaceae bacterium]|nr:NAD(P)H-dependent oxidoreductase [Anaerolineaceae bacterium]
MRQILGISGSLRKASYNTSLLRTASVLTPDSVSIQIYDLSPLPLYNDDLARDNPPQAVNDFRSSIKKSSGLLIASPEYNYSFTSVLKNAIDWASTDTLGNHLAGKTNRDHGRISQRIWDCAQPTAPAPSADRR